MADDFRMVHVYLHPRARREIREILQRQPAEVSNAELILTAISTQHEAVLAHFAAGAPRRSGGGGKGGGLFDTSTYRRRQRGQTAPQVQFGARLHRRDIDTIAELVSRVPRMSRSAFIAACLELHVLGAISPYDATTP